MTIFLCQTLRTFLNGMIERKQGHVVAISSLGGVITFPCGVAYCASKFGVTGFMDALFDELTMLEQDFIKTTTVYPAFVNTRKDLSEKLDEVGILTRLNPDNVADFIVEGVLLNRRNIYIPSAAKYSLALKYAKNHRVQQTMQSFCFLPQLVPR